MYWLIVFSGVGALTGLVTAGAAIRKHTARRRMLRRLRAAYALSQRGKSSRDVVNDVQRLCKDDLLEYAARYLPNGSFPGGAVTTAFGRLLKAMQDDTAPTPEELYEWLREQIEISADERGEDGFGTSPARQRT